MRHGFEDVKGGVDVECDAVVVGSGAGGAVAALNLAAAGQRVVVLEAGPEVRPQDMTRDAPRFLARYFWDGGLRLIGGTTQSPSLQARCVGGGTVVNSAIMLKLPQWVRDIWREETHSGMFHHPDFEAAYDRAPGRYAAYGYEAMAVVLDSVGRADDPTDRGDVVDAFFDTGDRESILGTYSIDGVGDTTLRRLGAYRIDGRGRALPEREALTIP